jgi:DNA repair ATPase RecN
MTVTLDSLKQRVRAVQTTIDRSSGIADDLSARAQTARTEQESFKRVAELDKAAAALVNTTATEARASIEGVLSKMITSALKAILGSDYEVQLKVGTSRGKPSLSLSVSGGGYAQDAEPKDTRGGGVIDVIALASRLACLEIVQPAEIGLPLILDEPCDALDRERAPLAAEFLRALAEHTGRQIIIVTHNRQLAERADSVVGI